MQPKLIVKKSAWGGVTPLCVLFFWLIIPLIIMIWRIIVIKHEKVEFYDGYVIIKSGVLSKNSKRMILPGILSVSTSQSFFGRIFKYSHLKVDATGKFDVNMKFVSNYTTTLNYLEGLRVDAKDVKPIVVEH